MLLVHEQARQLRRDQTDVEKRLWSRLRDGQLGGVKFRRQFPIGDFIVDFCAREKRLIVELDGSQHAEAEGVQRDEWRSEQLRARGYQVLRFWNHEVQNEIDEVLNRIAAAIGISDD